MSLLQIQRKHMPSILLSAPAVEPVTLDEARSFLRVEHNADDEVIAALTAGSRIHVEAQTRRALDHAKLAHHARFLAARRPVDGAASAAAGADCCARLRCRQQCASCRRAGLRARPRRIGAGLCALGIAGAGRPAAGIELDVTVGYGDAAIDVPEPLRQAIRLLTAHWYDNRGLVAGGAGGALLPSTVAALIAPYRVMSL